MNFNINKCEFNLSFTNIVSLETTEEGKIFFSQKAKDPSVPSERNRARTTLNAIKFGIENGSQFMCGNDFGTEKISDVAQAIYVRYETRYNESWQSFIDKFTCCCGGKSDLEKMHDLLDEILMHSKAKTHHIKPSLVQSEDDRLLPSKSEDSEELDDLEGLDDQASLVKEKKLEENIPLPFEGSDEELSAFLSEKVFLPQQNIPNSLTLKFLEDLTESQNQRLVALNKKEEFLERMLEAICKAIAHSCARSSYKTDAALALFRALYQAVPESPLWEKFQNNACLEIPITVQKTISLLNPPLHPSIPEEDQKKLVTAIRSSFKHLEYHAIFEEYTHHILSYIVTLNSTEGSVTAQMKLKIFVMAIIPAIDKEDESGMYHSNTFGLISRAVHLDEEPISECCKHLPISPDFKLTPFILKTLIAEYAKNQCHWNYFVMHRIKTKEEALTLIETALELPEQQQRILLAAIYNILSVYCRSLNPQALFEEKGLDPKDYPRLPAATYNRLFTPKLSLNDYF